MTFPINLLPPEITNIILLNLCPTDVISLGKCIPLLITSKVYHHAFYDQTRHSHYDFKMFERRARAKFYVVGDLADQDEVNDYDEDIPSYYELFEDGFRRRMHTPCRVQFEGTIIGASLTGLAVHIIDEKGQVHSCEKYPAIRPEDFEILYQTHRATGRVETKDNFEGNRKNNNTLAFVNAYLDYVRHKEEAGDDPSFQTDGQFEQILKYGHWRFPVQNSPPPAVRKYSMKLYRQPYRPTRFVNIDSGDSDAMVDDTGVLWGWRDLYSHGAPVCIVDKFTGKANTSRVLKMHSFFDLSCYIEDEGIVMLEGPLDNLDTNGLRSGYACVDDYCWYCWSRTIQGTLGIQNYSLIDYDIVCLWPDGSLTGILQRDSCFPSAMEKMNALGPFTHVVSTINHIAALRTDGRVVYATVNDNIDYTDFTPRILEGLSCVVAIACGHYHCLALNDAGEVYTWGAELFANGCMGLGTLDKLKDREDVKIKERGSEFYLCVEKPTKIELPGKALAICASKYFSGFLIDDIPEL